jgi:hypothetical protein
VGKGNAAVKLVRRKGGALTLTARGLDLGALDDPTVTLGLRLGSAGFVGTATFHEHGRRLLH